MEEEQEHKITWNNNLINATVQWNTTIVFNYILLMFWFFY